MISYSNAGTPNYALGTVATYSCDSGFVLDLSVGSEMRTCIDDGDNDAEGVFDMQEPACVRKSILILFFSLTRGLLMVLAIDELNLQIWVIC